MSQQLCVGGCGFFASKGDYCSQGPDCQLLQAQARLASLQREQQRQRNQTLLAARANVSQFDLDLLITHNSHSLLTPLELIEFLIERDLYFTAEQARKFLQQCVPDWKSRSDLHKY
eukprot:TRINITY_DN7661_c0_g1_i1.p1 TRINITY_DN7661_c0_g1~~TRINITY_DN7661_c0_g1_i1.p1  ORF type:complete len:116 (-),score=30.65 TRINITY_DN7661_c0_g1_i1:337-684(-)